VGDLPENGGFCRDISLLVYHLAGLFNFQTNGGKMIHLDVIARLLEIAWLFFRLVSEIEKFLK
jgi:hypothetical protein